MTAKKITKKKATKASKKTKAKTGKNGKDNRKDLRVDVQLLVDYRSDGTYLFDFCRDLGTGGVFIQTNKPLKQGSPIELTFTIPDSKETLKAKGNVIWVQEAVTEDSRQVPGMGVQFDGFDAEQRKILASFVARYSSVKETEDVSSKSA